MQPQCAADDDGDDDYATTTKALCWQVLIAHVHDKRTKHQCRAHATSYMFRPHIDLLLDYASVSMYDCSLSAGNLLQLYVFLVFNSRVTITSC